MAGFDSILVANRGEIACRVIGAARALGYRTVAVHSAADAEARHVQMADRAIAIGPAEAKDSYLSIAAIIAAARRSGAQAVHPGYGFLSENAAFAQACAEAGLVFIGPPAAAIAAMGDKAAAKRRMRAAGVPCVPGYDDEDQAEAVLLAAAERIGLPLMVKAAAGGGGRGLRRVSDAAALPGAIATARAEAVNAFGSGALILEKAIDGARHVEIQVFADGHGNILHLGERDCSVQRRHQKVLEEAPSPAVDADLRARMGAAAVAAAQAIGYVGAGTVEFLLDGNGRDFYFLEMNTRLQVEHPVTEMVTGRDLVALQIEVAAGAALPFTQVDVAIRGHAIEARLYAEAPAQDFLPQSGRLAMWQPPEGAGIRVDHGLRSGQAITPFYDPLLAKVIAHGATREEARRRLRLALERMTALGIATNRGFLIGLLDHGDFAAGRATTDFIARAFAEIAAPEPDADVWALAAALWFERDAARHGHDPARSWHSAGALAWPLRLECGDATRTLSVAPAGPGCYRIDDRMVAVQHGADGHVQAMVAGAGFGAVHAFADDRLHLACGRHDFAIAETLYRPPAEAAAVAAERELRAPMNGKIVAVLAAPGEQVKKGQRVVILEAMKMQHEMVARCDATVAALPVKVGDQVATRQLLAALQPLAE